MTVQQPMQRVKWWVVLGICLLLHHGHVVELSWAAASRGHLNFYNSSDGVKLGNDEIQITLGEVTKKGRRGCIRSLTYNYAGAEVELLETNVRKLGDKHAGYWDMHWYETIRHKPTGKLHSPPVENVTIHNTKCSFGQANKTTAARTQWNGHQSSEEETLGVTYHQEMKAREQPKSTPLNTQVHYAVREGVSGVYAALQADHGIGDVPLLLAELRLVLMLNPKIFDYSYIADDRQRLMPTDEDISEHSSVELDFREARLLTRPENPFMAGEVDHKYTYSVETKDSAVYGWISTELRIGLWVISPNKWEYLAGGPTKQELSVQTGPKLLAMLHSQHYGTPCIDLKAGEEWEKVFGPFLIYVNKATNIKDLISDAKARAAIEAKSWPYEWVPFQDYKPRERRGTVVGRLVAQRRPWEIFRSKIVISAGSWVGLTDERSETSNWEFEVKTYQFWNTTNSKGEFTVRNVRPGNYVLQFIVHGVLVDSLVLPVVMVGEGRVYDVGEVLVDPVQRGSTVWEIGHPDRSAGEFLIPLGLHRSKVQAPSASDSNKFRQYGLWENYVEMYPERDPVFRVGESDWRSDWYFAHVLRPDGPRDSNKFTTTQREIAFELTDGHPVKGDYTLRLAIAGAFQAAVEVRVNDPDGLPLFDTGPFGRDNALKRAGVHGQYFQFSVSLSHRNLQPGWNSVYLRQSLNRGLNDEKFNYVMYDYVRLEAPASGLYVLHGQEPQYSVGFNAIEMSLGTTV